MKIFRLPQLTESTGGGEFCLGPEELSTDSVYIVYGRLCPGESNRLIESRETAEEVVCVTKGKLLVSDGAFDFKVGEGEAFCLSGNSPLKVANPADDEEAVYIICGGDAAGASEEMTSKEGVAPKSSHPDAPGKPATD